MKISFIKAMDAQKGLKVKLGDASYEVLEVVYYFNFKQDRLVDIYFIINKSYVTRVTYNWDDEIAWDES